MLNRKKIAGLFMIVFAAAGYTVFGEEKEESFLSSRMESRKLIQQRSGN